MMKSFPNCPLCNNTGQYKVSPSFTVVECEVCNAKFLSQDFKNKDKLTTLMLFNIPRNIISENLITKLKKIQRKPKSINFWQELQTDQEIIEFQKKSSFKRTSQISLENDERIITKTSGGWEAILGKQRGSLILTNQRLIFGDSSNSIYLKEIKNIDIISISAIEMNLEDRAEILTFQKRSIGHAIDIFASALFATPFEAGSWQEEVSSYTSYWASILTMSIFLFGQIHEEQVSENREEKHEDKKVWCSNCQKYVSVPWTDTPVWELSCPECGKKPLTLLSPKDRL